MSAAVLSVRDRLGPEVNARYRDYQIDRWVRHKGGDEAAVLRTIGNQHLNEDPIRGILRDADQPGSVFEVLDLNFTAFVPNPDTRQLLVFTQCAKEPRMSPEMLTQLLLVTDYYLLGRLEELYGDGATASLIQDQRNQTLNLADMKSRIQLIGEIGGRSFPFMISHVHLVNDWGTWTKGSVNAFLGMKKPSGATTTLCSDQELLGLLDRRLVPTYLGGNLDTHALHPEGCGTMMKAWFLGGGLRRMGFLAPAAASATTPPATSRSADHQWPSTPGRSPHSPTAGGAGGGRVLDAPLPPLPMPPVAPPQGRSTLDVAGRVGGVALGLFLCFVSSPIDLLLLLAGASLAWYAQALLRPPGGGAEAATEALRVALVRHAAEDCETLVRSRIGDVDFRDRSPTIADLAEALAERLSPAETRALGQWVEDVAAAWPLALGAPEHLPPFQRWAVFYRWLQAANTGISKSSFSDVAASNSSGDLRRASRLPSEVPDGPGGPHHEARTSPERRPSGTAEFRGKIKKMTRDLHFRPSRTKPGTPS